MAIYSHSRQVLYQGEMMVKTYSIEQAHLQFIELVRAVEHESVIQLTQRGQLVAVLLSPSEFNRLRNNQIGFEEAYEQFRQNYVDKEPDMDVDEIFGNVRD